MNEQIIKKGNKNDVSCASALRATGFRGFRTAADVENHLCDGDGVILSQQKHSISSHIQYIIRNVFFREFVHFGRYCFQRRAVE